MISEFICCSTRLWNLPGFERDTLLERKIIRKKAMKFEIMYSAHHRNILACYYTVHVFNDSDSKPLIH